MAKANDPALYESNYERNRLDRFFTEPWVTNALLRRLPLADRPGRVWESAAGRGDMVNVLMDHGIDVFASDVDMSEFDGGSCPSLTLNFLAGDFEPEVFDVTAIVTNPPYGSDSSRTPLAEAFVRRALSYESVGLVAMLVRTEFASAGGRADLFDRNQHPFAFEVRLTTRPRWDWWFRDKPEASPRHYFSWLVWDREWQGPCTTYWEGKPKRRSIKK